MTNYEKIDELINSLDEKIFNALRLEITLRASGNEKMSEIWRTKKEALMREKENLKDHRNAMDASYAGEDFIPAEYMV